MTDSKQKVAQRASTAPVERFLAEAERTRLPADRATHRLIFALDATASRQPTWDLATELHDGLFVEATRHGNIAVQLCHYRGIGEFAASHWISSPAQLRATMSAVHCRGGRTQLQRLLLHAATEGARHPVRCLIFIGDACEEDPTAIERAAGQLAIRDLPVFIFQERDDPAATRVFRSIAAITRGAHVRFDANSADELRRLLGAVAQFAAGGRAALEQYAKRLGDAGVRGLLAQLGKP